MNQVISQDPIKKKRLEHTYANPILKPAHQCHVLKTVWLDLIKGLPVKVGVPCIVPCFLMTGLLAITFLTLINTNKIFIAKL